MVLIERGTGDSHIGWPHPGKPYRLSQGVGMRKACSVVPQFNELQYYINVLKQVIHKQNSTIQNKIVRKDYFQHSFVDPGPRGIALNYFLLGLGLAALSI